MMKYTITKLVCISTVIFWAGEISASSTEINFSAQPGVSVKVIVNANKVTVISNGIIDKNINDLKIDTEKKLNIKIEDFNFDGMKDLSISHIDDGMGVYFLDRIFLYVKKDKNFVELMPACGDEFINLNVEKKIKKISYTKFVGGKPFLCQVKFKH